MIEQGDALDVERRSRPVARVALVLVPVVALLVVFGIASFRGQSRDVGARAPAFSLEHLDGKGRISSRDFEGRAYALNFWASWCIPCRDEAPTLAKVAGPGSAEPAFIGVNVLDGRSDAREFVKEFGIRYPNGRDPGGVFRAFGVAGIPETIFVSRDGRIVGRYIGGIDEATLRRLLAEVVRVGPDETLRISGRGPSVGVP